MLRLLARAVAACSLLLGVAFTALGVVSHWRGSLLGWLGERQSVFVRTEYGVMAFHQHASDAGGRRGVLNARWPHPPGLAPPMFPDWWRNGGFGYAVGGTAGGNAVRQWRVPCWAAVLGSGLLPVASPVGYLRRRRRERTDRCPRCGYDLTGNVSGVCPECGTAVVR